MSLFSSLLNNFFSVIGIRCYKFDSELIELVSRLGDARKFKSVQTVITYPRVPNLRMKRSRTVRNFEDLLDENVIDSRSSEETTIQNLEDDDFLGMFLESETEYEVSFKIVNFVTLSKVKFAYRTRVQLNW